MVLRSAQGGDQFLQPLPAVSDQLAVISDVMLPEPAQAV
jgi:hypothetical protein